MKYIYVFILSTLLLFSCSVEEDESILVESLRDLRLEPTIPSLIYPTNDLVCTNFNLEFDWNRSTSIYKKPLDYVIEIATDRGFENLLFTTTTSETESNFTLEKGTYYFWRVKAKDNKGNESLYSSIQTFITEPEGNTNILPSISSSSTPITGAIVTGNTTRLSWNANDHDADSLVYDVYFGESNPPQLVAENIDVTTLDVQIEANKTYYWRIVAKDDKQGVAIGRVWNFSTQ
ncbi:hypothetical protein [Aquimarina sp. AU119]|uniref:hypothetical protein n=1 Tax=Aquimarina sp. AU119 TaxID=2108528 RepID=UPI000D68A665|nr:hypothetical protein [Aquimarina sp. AU119]